MSAMKFTPKPTKAENIEAAKHWLQKAIDLEQDKKSEGIVNKALDRAIAYEDAAVA